MNKSEAEAKAKELIDKRASVFCPLIRNRCSVTCECFRMPDIYCIGENGELGVSGGYCTAHCLVGD